MDVMILDNVCTPLPKNIQDLSATGQAKTLKRTLSAPDNVCRKRCRCENCREEFQQLRAERKAEIALRKAERMAARVDRLAAKIEREAAKAERKAAKAAKAEKKEAKTKRKSTKSERVDIAMDKKEGGQTHELSKQFCQLACSAYDPSAGEKILSKGFSKIVIDGNNMLFVTDTLRKNTLHGKRKQSEKLLSVAALAFSQLVGVTTEVIFDTTQLPKKTFNLDETPRPSAMYFKSSVPEFTTEVAKMAKDFPVIGVPISFTDGTYVLVSSARPEFATTDDKLIAWARANQQELSPSSGPKNSDVIVVSSDRALAGELYSLGVSLIKPGNWIALFASLLGEDQSSQKGALFKWFDSYCISLSSD